MPATPSRPRLPGGTVAGMQTAGDDEPSITRERDPDRFEVAVDGQVAGFAQFVDTDLHGSGARVFFHTEIGEAFGGRGLAGAVVHAALESTRAAGLRVVPVCPYVKKYVATHEEWSDLVDRVTPEALAAIPR